jgi:hypothetical protein
MAPASMAALQGVHVITGGGDDEGTYLSCGFGAAAATQGRPWLPRSSGVGVVHTGRVLRPFTRTHGSVLMASQTMATPNCSNEH